MRASKAFSLRAFEAIASRDEYDFADMGTTVSNRNGGGGARTRSRITAATSLALRTSTPVQSDALYASVIKVKGERVLLSRASTIDLAFT